MSEQLATVAARFERAPYNARLGLRVETIGPDRVRVRIPYKDENSNPGKALHGGVPASTINIAGVLAAWTGFSNGAALETGTLDLSVNYLAAAIGEDIVATAEVLRRGKEIVYSDVDVRNDAGKRIAKGLVTYRSFDRRTNSAAGERQRTATAPAMPKAGDVPPMARALTAVPFIARLGMSIESMRDGLSLLYMPFRPENADHGDVVHEGALAALIDTAGAMASWSIVGLNLRYKASTVGIHVNYHAPATREDVVAVGRTLRRNNEIFLNEVTVAAQASGRVIATGSVTYRIVVL